MGWRKHQYKTKVAKRNKLGLIVLGFLALLIIFYQLLNFNNFIHKPLKVKTQKTYTWDGQFNLNLVLNTKPITVVSYNPSEKQITTLTIPDETYIDAGSFGKWQVRSIYDLGKTSNMQGASLLEKSLSSFLGIPIDGFASENLVSELRNNFFAPVSLLGRLQTDLTPLELMRLKIGLMQVRFDKIKQIDLAKSGILEKANLADSTQVFVSDPVKLDSILPDFADKQIRSENLSISIFNATERPLLAQKAQRIVVNLGGNVISIQNAPQVLQKSYVEGSPSKTLIRLNQIFNTGCTDLKCDKIPKEELGAISGRAQIIIVLGSDFP